MSSERTYKCCDEKLKLIYVRDIPMTEIFNPKYVEEALDYVPRDNDIIVCSYPKTGTTWLQYIVWKILHKDEALPDLDSMTTKHVPFLEMAGTGVLETLEQPRVYKHHLPYKNMKINEKAKYIYIHRNPMDTAVSYYHFLKNIHTRLNLSFVEFNEFIEKFIEGVMSYGDFFDHVLQFYEHRNDSHLLLISYEDLHENKKGQILKIAKFLGENYYQDLMKDEVALQEIVRVTEFNHMKQNVTSVVEFEKDGKTEKRNIDMFRKGIVGDSKNALTPEQIKQLNTKMMKKVNDPTLLKRWSL